MVTMIKNHTPETLLQAQMLTLQEIQEVIFDVEASRVGLVKANQEIQRHALELRLLQQQDIPQSAEPLQYARQAARAIERARCARDRLRDGGPDLHRGGPNHPGDLAGAAVVQTSVGEHLAAGDLEEGSADVDGDLVHKTESSSRGERAARSGPPRAAP